MNKRDEQEGRPFSFQNGTVGTPLFYYFTISLKENGKFKTANKQTEK